MLYIGKNRAEAIDAIQDMLGPQTPRNIAEDTYVALVAEGKVDVDFECILLAEEIEGENLHRRARNTMVMTAQKTGAMRRLARRANPHAHHSRFSHNRFTDNTPDGTGKRRDDNDDQ